MGKCLIIGCGGVAGVAIHKWVAPAIGKGVKKIKNGIVTVLTKDDKKYIEVESENEDKSEDSDN